MLHIAYYSPPPAFLTQAAQGEEGAASEALRAAEAAYEAAEKHASKVTSETSVPMVDPATGNDLSIDPNKLNVAQLQVWCGRFLWVDGCV